MLLHHQSILRQLTIECNFNFDIEDQSPESNASVPKRQRSGIGICHICSRKYGRKQEIDFQFMTSGFVMITKRKQKLKNCAKNRKFEKNLLYR